MKREEIKKTFEQLGFVGDERMPDEIIDKTLEKINSQGNEINFRLKDLKSSLVISDERNILIDSLMSHRVFLINKIEDGDYTFQGIKSAMQDIEKIESLIEQIELAEKEVSDENKID